MVCSSIKTIPVLDNRDYNLAEKVKVQQCEHKIKDVMLSLL